MDNMKNPEFTAELSEEELARCKNGPIPSIVCQISPEEKAECEKVFFEKGVDGCLQYFHEKQDQWKQIPLNVGVIGNSGVGKSSFINTIRGLWADDEGAAAVGVNETTVVPTPYDHPCNSNLKFWDLPGVGTPKFPKESYLSTIGFEKFDFFILLTASRFTENDMWLAGEIINCQKTLYFVRTQIGIDIDKENKGRRVKRDPEEIVNSIRKNVEDNLGELKGKIKIFLIDSYEKARFDFANLEKCLVEDAPELKRKAMILSLGCFSEQILRQKVEILRGDIWKTAAISAAGAAIPVVGVAMAVDVVIVAKQIQFYYEQLGLNPQAIERSARLYNVDADRLKQIMRDELPFAEKFSGGKSLSKEDAAAVVKFLWNQSSKIFLCGASLIGEEFARYIPFVGSAVASALSYGTTYNLLSVTLGRFETVALKIVKVCLEN